MDAHDRHTNAYIDADTNCDLYTIAPTAIDSSLRTVTPTATPATIDLSLSKEVAPPLVAVGDDVTYTIVVTNTGTTNATGVMISDMLPAA